MSSTSSGNAGTDRQLAISAAAAVFAEKGFHNTTLDDIATQIGIDTDSLGTHFRSTADALYEVCLYGMCDYVDRMNTITASDQSFQAKLVAVVTFHVNKYRERIESLTVYHAERLALKEDERMALKALGDSYRDHLIEIFEDGIESGSIRDSIDCKFAAQAVIGMCDRWGQLVTSNPDLETAYIIENCIDLLINGFMDKVGSDRISIDL